MRERYYRRYMREWCRRHRLPWIAAYRQPQYRADIISLTVIWRISLGLSPTC